MIRLEQVSVTYPGGLTALHPTDIELRIHRPARRLGRRQVDPAALPQSPQPAEFGAGDGRWPGQPEWNAEAVPLYDLLSRSDYVVPMVPTKPDTLHLIDRSRLSRMKNGSILVNACRGSVVDENTVAEVLATGKLAAYAADVLELEEWAREDRPRTIPRTLLDHSRTFFTPHLGSAVDGVRREIALEAARNIPQALAGERPQGALNDPRNRKRA